jgi:hypothetical protein
MFTPATAVYLCNTPLKSDNKNQLTFESRSDQFNYFNSLAVRRFSDFTYQRKDSIIRVPINAEVLFNDGVNYVMYDNKNFSTRWIYAYITKIEYVNANVSHIHIKTDVFQTWFLECRVLPSFVVRETVINDELFKHTLPENLPTGEQVTVATTTIADSLNSQSVDEFDNNYYCVVMTSEPVKWLSATIPAVDSFVGGVANPCYMYATSLSDFYGFMDKITENGQVNAVVCCVAIPKFFVNFHELDTGGGTGGGGETGVNYLGSPYSASFTITQTYNPPNHYGIDMVGLSDKNIYSPVAGTVVDSRWENDSDHSQGYGQLVRILDSESGLYFIFGHLSERSVSEGDTVTAGQKIGVEGSTGNSTGSHLHYQVSSDWNSGTVNPANYGTFQNIEGVQ